MTRQQPSIRASRGIGVAGAAGALLVAGVLISGCGSSGSSTPTATTPAGKFQAGYSALSHGNYQGAKDEFTAVVATNPTLASAQYNLGLAESGLKNNAAAAAAYEKAIALDPKMTAAMFNLADLQASTNPQAAIATLRHLLTITPNDHNAQFNLGYLLEQNGKVAEGKALLGKAIAGDPALRSRVPAGMKLP
jgi:tetratricopeptide (TPR) repeat protein